MADLYDLGAGLAPLSKALGDIFAGQLENEQNMPRVQDAASQIVQRQFTPLFDIEKYRQSKQLEAEKLDAQQAFNQARVADMESKNRIAAENAESNRLRAHAFALSAKERAVAYAHHREQQVRDMQDKLEERARVAKIREQLAQYNFNDPAQRGEIMRLIAQIDAKDLSGVLGNWTRPASEPRLATTESARYNQLMTQDPSTYTEFDRRFIRRYEARQDLEDEEKRSLINLRSAQKNRADRYDPAAATNRPIRPEAVMAARQRADTAALREAQIMLRDQFGITSPEKFGTNDPLEQAAILDFIKRGIFIRNLKSAGIPLQSTDALGPMPKALQDLLAKQAASKKNWLYDFFFSPGGEKQQQGSSRSMPIQVTVPPPPLFDSANEPADEDEEDDVLVSAGPPDNPLNLKLPGFNTR